MEYRNEWKYLVDAQTAAHIRFLMRAALTPDPHAPGGRYALSSLYFDDLYDTALHENLAGVDERQKFRLRSYGGPVHLEDKQKLRGFTRKESCPMTEAEWQALAAGQPLPIDPARPLLNRALLAVRLRRLRPVVTVLYDRTAFVGRAGNVRVTLDSAIRAGRPEGFLVPGAPSLPILPQGQEILEVKFDELLPPALAQVLNLGSLEQIAFSKYTLCRQALPITWQKGQFTNEYSRHHQEIRSEQLCGR